MNSLNLCLLVFSWGRKNVIAVYFKSYSIFALLVFRLLRLKSEEAWKEKEEPGKIQARKGQEK